jgi:sulfur-oxidizing protein SoxA
MPPSNLRTLTLLVAVVIALGGIGAALAEAWDLSPYEVDGKKSGYLYMGTDTRALQDDDFVNPGMFAVDRGRDLWTAPGPGGQSCASCHADPETAMRGVAARYPVYDAEVGGLVNIEARINLERQRMGAEPFALESDDLLALSAFIGLQSRGEPMDVKVDGPAVPFFEEGKRLYHTRLGQLDLSCAQCHDDRAGMRLRGDLMSEGQVNNFPIFRTMWRTMASRQRMFQWCNTSMRAEPWPLGSPEYLALELYVAWRGNGLPMETPSVRR